MAWINSKTGKIYLAACAGVTLVLLGRDLFRGIVSHPAMAALLPFGPSDSQAPIVPLPPSGSIEYVPVLPIIRRVAIGEQADMMGGSCVRINAVTFTEKGAKPQVLGSGTRPFSVDQSVSESLSKSHDTRYRVILEADEYSLPREALLFGSVNDSGKYHSIYPGGDCAVALRNDEVVSRSLHVGVMQMGFARTVQQIRLRPPIAKNGVSRHGRTEQDGYAVYQPFPEDLAVSVPPAVLKRWRDETIDVQFLARTTNGKWHLLCASQDSNANRQDAPLVGDDFVLDMWMFRGETVTDIAVAVMPLQRVVFTNIPVASKR